MLLQPLDTDGRHRGEQDGRAPAHGTNQYSADRDRRRGDELRSHGPHDRKLAKDLKCGCHATPNRGTSASTLEPKQSATVVLPKRVDCRSREWVSATPHPVGPPQECMSMPLRRVVPSPGR